MRSTNTIYILAVLVKSALVMAQHQTGKRSKIPPGVRVWRSTVKRNACTPPMRMVNLSPPSIPPAIKSSVKKLLLDDGKEHLTPSLDTAGHRAFIDSKATGPVVDTRNGNILPKSRRSPFWPSPAIRHVTRLTCDASSGRQASVRSMRRPYNAVKTFDTPTYPNSPP